MMSRLRSRNGCPWDREQTLDTLQQFLVEECYELVDAIRSGDPDKHMDELGDILLQVLFQAQIRREEGRFDFYDVAERLAAKLVRRHPHVFGGEKARNSAEVLKRWEEIKAHEKSHGKGRRSALDGVPRSLPALLRAQRTQAKAARVGFDWTDVRDVEAKVREEHREMREALESGDKSRFSDELGDLLFASVNLARFKGVDAECALDSAVERFSRRFRAVEERVWSEGRKTTDCTLAELDAHWNTVKKLLSGGRVRNSAKQASHRRNRHNRSKSKPRR